MKICFEICSLQLLLLNYTASGICSLQGHVLRTKTATFHLQKTALHCYRQVPAVLQKGTLDSRALHLGSCRFGLQVRIWELLHAAQTRGTADLHLARLWCCSLLSSCNVLQGHFGCIISISRQLCLLLQLAFLVQYCTGSSTEALHIKALLLQPVSGRLSFAAAHKQPSPFLHLAQVPPLYASMTFKTSA